MFVRIPAHIINFHANDHQKAKGLTCVDVACPLCPKAHYGDYNKTWALEVNAVGMLSWLSRVLIQNALPELDDDTRDRLQTGLCAKHHDEVYNTRPEDEYGDSDEFFNCL